MKNNGDNWCILEDGKQPGEKTRLLVQNHWNPELFDVVKNFNVKSLQLTDWNSSISFLSELASLITELSVHGELIAGLEVLPKVTLLRRLTISDYSTQDMCVISELESLESLSIYGHLDKIDFTRLRKLRELYVNNEKAGGNWAECLWVQYLNIGNMRIKNLECLSKMVELRSLNVGSRALETFSGLEHLSQLESLVTGDMNWMSLSGIERSRGLKHLSVSFMPKLSDVRAIAMISGLKRLDITYCPRLSDISPLAELKELQILDLSDCKRLCSLRPLEGLKRLQSFYYSGNCKIDDGDSLSVLIDLPKLRFTAFRRWKHYSHTPEQIRDAITARGVRLAENLKEIELEP